MAAKAHHSIATLSWKDAFIALGIAAERERGGDAEDGVLWHRKRFGHRCERQALGMP
jgi:hypothetical protein